MTTASSPEINFFIEIIDGPSASKLVDAFKYAFDKDGSLTAAFTLKDNVKINFRVHSIEHEDGSNVSFNLTGYVVSINKTIFGNDAIINRYEFKATAYYNANKRKGVIRFISSGDYYLCKP